MFNNLNQPSEEFIESEVPSTTIESSTDDARILRSIEFELASSGAFEPEAIQVMVREGVATLSGELESNAEIILAENTTRAVEGVRNVSNNLVVSDERRIA